MRVVVCAYHDIGVVCLEELLRQEEEVVAVFTHEEDPQEKIWYGSVAETANRHRLPVYTPPDINAPEVVELIRDLDPDLLFSFYFRQMIQSEILSLPAKGCLNLHGSYLPKYRGRCPVNWVLINGETETGVTLHYMVEKPDAGDIVAQRKVSIDFTDTAHTLFAKMTAASADLMRETLPLLRSGQAPRLPPNLSEGSYYGGRKPADGRFEWSWPALRIYNLVRAVTHPYPGAFVESSLGKLFVWGCSPDPEDRGGEAVPGTLLSLDAPGPGIATGERTLYLTHVQLEGAPECSGNAFVSCNNLQPGQSLALL